MCPSISQANPVGGRPSLLFDGWIQRPDCTDRMGWESPELAEADRLWARSTFDDLPGPMASDGELTIYT